VGGVLSGLGDSRVGLELAYGNGYESDLSLDDNGAFTFDAFVPSGSRYSVTVTSQPKRQTCRVANGSGTVVDADISGVRVTCSGDDDDGDD
jgi:hypothetical protein